jgi:tRNA A-37 threonylcarbamoyl transferase component Bud32
MAGTIPRLNPNMKNYVKLPDADQVKLIRHYLDEEKGLFFYFRHMCLRMQDHFSTLLPLDKMPKVFIHGNPHTENYVITERGAGMVDFDRSRIGPYAWDVVRFLCSLSLKRADTSTPFLSAPVLEYFREGYMRGFELHKTPYKEVSKTVDRANFDIWYPSTREYLEAEVKWAKEIHKSPLKPNNKAVQKILESYLKSRNEEALLKTYRVEMVGKAKGTFGNKRLLLVLDPKQTSLDKILLELKTVYQDADTAHFFNPHRHHGLRMIKASDLYAPQVEQRLGYATYKGQEYWGRQIPPSSAKIKDKLNEFEQVDIAYSVGTQLGRAHRKSLQKEGKPDTLFKHFLQNYDLFIGIGVQMNQELIQGHQKYIELYHHKLSVLKEEQGEAEHLALAIH